MQWLFGSQLKSKDPERRIDAIEQLVSQRDDRTRASVYSMLSDRVAEVRVAAVKVMSQWQDDFGMRALAAALRDPAPSVRETAIVGLRSLYHASTIPTITPMLCDVNSRVRTTAARTLEALRWTPENDAQRALLLIASGKYSKAAAMGTVAIEMLLALLDDESATVRRDVAETIAAFPQKRVAAALQKLIKDPEAGVRMAALSSLGKLNEFADTTLIAGVLQDVDKNVRIAAIEALGASRSVEHVPLLTRCLKDAQWNVRTAAAMALARTGAASVIPALVELLNDEDPDVRCAAIEALGVLRSDASIEALVMTQLDPESGVRVTALKALSRINMRWHQTPEAQRTMPVLKRAMQSENYWVRHVAGDLMAKIFNIQQFSDAVNVHDLQAQSRARALDVLVPALWDEDALLRGAAAEALGRLREKRAADALTARLRDAHEWVRQVAQASLQQLETASAKAATDWASAAP